MFTESLRLLASYVYRRISLEQVLIGKLTTLDGKLGIEVGAWPTRTAKHTKLLDVIEAVKKAMESAPHPLVLDAVVFDCAAANAKTIKCLLGLYGNRVLGFFDYVHEMKLPRNRICRRVRGRLREQTYKDGKTSSTISLAPLIAAKKEGRFEKLPSSVIVPTNFQVGRLFYVHGFMIHLS